MYNVDNERKKCRSPRLPIYISNTMYLYLYLSTPYRIWLWSYSFLFSYILSIIALQFAVLVDKGVSSNESILVHSRSFYFRLLILVVGSDWVYWSILALLHSFVDYFYVFKNNNSILLFSINTYWNPFQDSTRWINLLLGTMPPYSNIVFVNGSLPTLLPYSTLRYPSSCWFLNEICSRTYYRVATSLMRNIIIGVLFRQLFTLLFLAKQRTM
jgi:hypothetical protein